VRFAWPPDTIDGDVAACEFLKKEAIMVVVFLGPPGSGKGTQAVRLARKQDLQHLSTGDLLREAMKNGATLGKQAAHYVNEGKLVPDELVSGLVEERIMKNSRDFLLDGYPRNLSQAKDLERIVENTGQDLAAVILLDVPPAELINRLAGRGRTDDTPETVRQRLAVYEAETSPLIDFYETEGNLVRVDGVGSIEEIHTRVLNAFLSRS
jgi:adenylate kinase